MADHCYMLVLAISVSAVTSEPSRCDQSFLCGDNASQPTTNHEHDVSNLCQTHYRIYSAFFTHPYTTVCSSVRTNVYGEFHEYYMNEHTAYRNGSEVIAFVSLGWGLLFAFILCCCWCSMSGRKCGVSSPEPAPAAEPVCTVTAGVVPPPHPLITLPSYEEAVMVPLEAPSPTSLPTQSSPPSYDEACYKVDTDISRPGASTTPTEDIPLQIVRL